MRRDRGRGWNDRRGGERGGVRARRSESPLGYRDHVARREAVVRLDQTVLEDGIEEGGYRTGRYGLEARHSHGRRRGMSREGEGSSIADQSGDGRSALEAVAEDYEAAYD